MEMDDDDLPSNPSAPLIFGHSDTKKTTKYIQDIYTTYS